MRVKNSLHSSADPDLNGSSVGVASCRLSKAAMSAETLRALAIRFAS